VKGVVLAGGLGTRLLPMTRVTNKHLLPVFDRPMIYFPIQQLVHAGIDDILIVTGGNHAGDFLRLLGNGTGFGLRRLNYAYQEGEGGIAEALGLAEDFADGEPICVILGDNIFEAPIREAMDAYRADPEGAMVLLKEVDHPERFGVAELREGRVVSIVEKPAEPQSNLAVTGCYFYDGRVFEIVQGLSPSGRGELEITDVNSRYLEWGSLYHHVVSGWWTDAGTIPSLHHATQLVAAAEEAPVLRMPEVGTAPPEGGGS
jgi:glucose-1-phosphate thymidylyltransferase